MAVVVEMKFDAFASKSALISLAQLFYLFTLLFFFRSGESIVPFGVSLGMNSWNPFEAALYCPSLGTESYLFRYSLLNSDSRPSFLGEATFVFDIPWTEGLRITRALLKCWPFYPDGLADELGTGIGGLFRVNIFALGPIDCGERAYVLGVIYALLAWFWVSLVLMSVLWISPL